MVIKTGRYQGQTLECYGNVIMRFYKQDTATPSHRFCIGGKKFKAGKTKRLKIERDSPIEDVEQIEVGHVICVNV